MNPGRHTSELIIKDAFHKARFTSWLESSGFLRVLLAVRAAGSTGIARHHFPFRAVLNPRQRHGKLVLFLGGFPRPVGRSARPRQ